MDFTLFSSLFFCLAVRLDEREIPFEPRIHLTVLSTEIMKIGWKSEIQEKNTTTTTRKKSLFNHWWRWKPDYLFKWPRLSDIICSNWFESDFGSFFYRFKY